jgi:hypothetical protein
VLYDFYPDPDAMGSAPVGIGKAISTNHVRPLETSGLEMLAVSLSRVDPKRPSSLSPKYASCAKKHRIKCRP